MIKLYQIVITKEIAKRVNAGETIAKFEASRDAMCFGEFTGREHYDHVADLDTDDLDDAFRIGNIGPESSITRHDRMHSVSVGDVLVKADGTAHIVKACGFELLPFDASRKFVW